MTSKGKSIPPPPAVEDDVALVKTLEIPSFDKTREFQGIAKLKISRKDKHMKALDEFAKLLDVIAEQIEVDLLKISREMRERLEQMDDIFQKDFKDLDDDSYLIIRSEADLFSNLSVLKSKVDSRSGIIETFAVDLDGLETKRATIVGNELKRLVDTLVAIAHQLPDEIEHIVESETFDLNSVLTKNRQAHAQILALLRKRQIEVEVEVLQRWEDSRRKWRQLRHNKCVNDFNVDIRSERFTEPANRRTYLAMFRDGQKDRQQQRVALLERYGQFTAENIKSADITPLQQEFSAIAEAELNSIQDCYNRLTELRLQLKQIAEQRVESFRKELHLYGALKIEPILHQEVFETALSDPALTDLWRLGGGLKPEFQAFVQEFQSTDLAYERLVGSLETRLDLIASGFTLRAVLTERGRASFLDKMRGVTTKLRSVPRIELPALLEQLVQDLDYFVTVEQLPATFRNTVKECIQEMQQDMERVKVRYLYSIQACSLMTGFDLFVFSL